MKKISLIIVIFYFLLPCSINTQDLLLGKIEKKFSSINRFSANFTELLISTAGETQSFEGKIFIAKPCSLRMETTAPEEQIILYNGNTAWVYLPQKKYCLRYNSGSLINLSNIPNYIFAPFKNLKVDTLYSDTGSIFIKLHTKEENEFFKSVELKISKIKMLPSAITLTDRIGNKMNFNFFNILVNDKRKIGFSFIPEDSVKIIEN